MSSEYPTWCATCRPYFNPVEELWQHRSYCKEWKDVAVAHFHWELNFPMRRWESVLDIEAGMYELSSDALMVGPL